MIEDHLMSGLRGVVMHHLSLLLLAFGFLSQPVIAQEESVNPSSRAYAPERLSTLSVSDQTRVLEMEYREQSGGRRLPDDQLRFYLDQIRHSNWTFSRIKEDIATSLRGNGDWKPPPGGGWGGNAQETAVIRCESFRGRYRECVKPFAGKVRVIRQLAGAQCAKGHSWGQRDGTIWVSKDCRADFEVRARSAYMVTCTSRHGRFTTCAWDRSLGMPELIERLSNTRCMRGRDWGYEPKRGVWVANGCNARFGVKE